MTGQYIYTVKDKLSIREPHQNSGKAITISLQPLAIAFSEEEMFKVSMALRNDSIESNHWVRFPKNSI
jgi:hypothetical protein